MSADAHTHTHTVYYEGNNDKNWFWINAAESWLSDREKAQEIPVRRQHAAYLCFVYVSEWWSHVWATRHLFSGSSVKLHHNVATCVLIQNYSWNNSFFLVEFTFSKNLQFYGFECPLRGRRVGKNNQDADILLFPNLQQQNQHPTNTNILSSHTSTTESLLILGEKKYIMGFQQS